MQVMMWEKLFDTCTFDEASSLIYRKSFYKSIRKKIDNPKTIKFVHIPPPEMSIWMFKWVYEKVLPHRVIRKPQTIATKKQQYADTLKGLVSPNDT